jgi:hypothetical protein
MQASHGFLFIGGYHAQGERRKQADAKYRNQSRKVNNTL